MHVSPRTVVLTDPIPRAWTRPPPEITFERGTPNMGRGRSIRAGSRQRSHADFLEPHEVAGVMILQADVAHRGTLRLPFRLVPLLLGRHVRTFGIEALYLFPIEMHNNSFARERDEHRLPFAGRLVRNLG